MDMRQSLGLSRALRLLARPIPVWTLTLRTHARLVLCVAWYPFMLASLTLVLIDSDLFLSHTSHYIPKIIYRQVTFLLT